MGEVRLGFHSQDTDDGAYPRQRSPRGILDGSKHGRRALGVDVGEGLPGLGLDDDVRHVVADGVVQVANELVTRSELGLLDVTGAGGGVQAAGGPEFRCLDRPLIVDGTVLPWANDKGEHGDARRCSVHERQIQSCAEAWQALLAESYLDVSAFSRSGLIDQLIYGGFSAEQAAYGADQAGL